MAYEKQNFTDGQVLEAEHLNHIEDGIENLTASDVGALPLVRAVDNLTDLLNTPHWGAYTINDNDGTGGTPKTDGLTNVTSYLVFSYGSSANNGFQFAFPSGTSTDVFYFRRKTGGTVHKWTSPLVPDGSVPTTGEIIWLNKGLGRLLANKYAVTLAALPVGEDVNNLRGIAVYQQGHRVLADSIRVFDKVDGVETLYRVYGEHNKELLTESVKSLPLADGYTEAYTSYYYKNADGDVVVQFYISASETESANTRYTIATLPAGYRPIKFAPSAIILGSATNAVTGSLMIDSSGNMIIVGSENWSSARGTIVFKAGN